MHVTSLKVSEPPAQWRITVGLAVLGIGVLATGLGLLFLQGGSLLGLVPAIPGGLLIYGGQHFVRNAKRSSRVLCTAWLKDHLLCIDDHYIRLDEDYFVVLAHLSSLTTATFVQGGQTRAVAWRSYAELTRPGETGARAERRVGNAWDFEGELRDLTFGGKGNLGPALMSALEATAEHDRLEVLRHSLEDAVFSSPDPTIEQIDEISDGSVGRSMPYRGGATSPEDGQRFLDDFRKHALELVPGVHVGSDYVTVQGPAATTVIPIGKVTAEVDDRSLEVESQGGNRGQQRVVMPDPASAELVARLLREKVG